MEFLRLFEGIRVPALNAFMAAVTYAGDETVFMIIAITLFWCVSKRQGYYVFAVSIAGTTLSQWLKLIFRIPRPWVLDPSFTIVEAAREGAGGYSFPSGHTQGVVGTFGALAMSNRQKWLRAVCIALILIVPFSRMYLGVHTPLDVGVAFVLAAALVLAFYPCYRDEERFRRSNLPVYIALLALVLCYIAWMHMTTFPADVDMENLTHGIKNGWSLIGSAAGLVVSYRYDEKKLHFDVKAPLGAQLLKIGFGLALLMGIRVGAKAALTAAFGDALWPSAVRYFLMVIFAGCLWPMTFPWFAKIGAKRA